MMDRIPLLAGILAVQIVLVGLVSMGAGDQQAAATLLTLEADAVSGLDITDGEGIRISLDKLDGQWRLADGNPADQSKVRAVLDDLAGLVAAWPVATSGDSQKRFEVTPDNFQRRLVFREADTELATVYLGTSPGYRRVHARRDDDDSVFSIDFANHQVPAGLDEWLNKDLLRATEITTVALADGGRLELGDDGWLLDGEAADQDAVADLVGRIEDLRVIGYRGETGAASGEDGAASGLTGAASGLTGAASGLTNEAIAQPRSIEVRSAEGRYLLTFSHDAENDDYRLESDRYPGLFAVASYVAEQILVDAASLRPAPDVPAADPSEAPDGGAAAAQPDRAEDA